MKFLVLIAALFLVSCGTTAHESRITLHEVKVPVPVPCPLRAGPATVYPDSDEALRMAPDLFARVQLLLAGRRLRNEDLKASTQMLKACSSMDVNPVTN